MNAHSHAHVRPPLWTTGQAPQMGTPFQRSLVEALIDACWTSEDAHRTAAAVSAVAADPGALLTLRRVCTLQDSGQVRWAHGTAEGDAEVAKLHLVDTATMQRLAAAGGRMWVDRAQLFSEVADIGKYRARTRIVDRGRGARPRPRRR